MPPVGAQGKAFDQLRTVNGSLRPLIGCLRNQERVSANEHFDIVLSGVKCFGLMNLYVSKISLPPCRRQLYYCRRMKRFTIGAAQR